MSGDISSQIHEIMEVQITGKNEEVLNKEIEGRVHKEEFGMIWLGKRGCI